jgi:flagellar M-ring protein FliF
MLDRLPKSLRRLLAMFGSFSAGQKAVTAVGIVALLVGGFFFATWASKPTYAPLFSNLSSADAGAIVEELSAEGTSYELADGGQTVMVPKESVYDLRVKLSGKGLPAQADSGYSLLDKQGITTSEFMQHVGYQRALEGELAKTIGSIDGVKAANVHLVIPQKDVFSDDAQKPTASVLVTEQSGNQLDQGQVQAIVHMVSASVEGLAADQVTVADSSGKVLSAGGGESVAAAGDLRSQQTTEYEQRLNGALQSMLNSVVGPGHAVVKTTADLDFDQTETKTQKYTADPKTPPLSSTKKTETYNGAGGQTGGVLGPDNIQVPNGNGSGDGTYASTDETVNNAVGVVTETRKSAPGNVRRLSVSVLLDATTSAAVNNADVEKMVSSAVGLNATRGDTVAVTAMPFDNSAAEKSAAEEAATALEASQKQTEGYVKAGAMGLAVLVLLFLAWRYKRRTARRAGLSDAEQAKIEQMQDELAKAKARVEAAERAAAAKAEATAEAAATTTTVPLDLETEDMLSRQKDLSVLAERKPAEVAQLLRGWISERRS